MKIGVLTAMTSEFEQLAAMLDGVVKCEKNNIEYLVGCVGENEIVLRQCGIGKVNAALGAQILVSKFDVKKLLNFGVAGSLNKTTELCSVYQISAATQFDFDLVQLNGTKIGTLNEYEESYLSLNLLPAQFPKRKLATADRFNDSIDDYKLLTEELNADIRDMEGGAVVQAAYAAQLPVYAIKAISDVAGSGSTTEQYLINKDKALTNLKALLPTIFDNL